MSITKGPWEVETFLPETYQISANSKVFSIIPKEWQTLSTKEFFSNARAISKVPEMVEAIQGLLTLISNEQPNWSFEEISEAQAILDYIEQD